MTEPKVMQCMSCDFGSGHRGMDYCGKCGGTGSLLVVRIGKSDHFFHNTEQGYARAKEKLELANQPKE